MKIRVSDPKRVPALLSYLEQRPDVIAERVGRAHISVSLLGSRNAEANQVELRLRLRDWLAGHLDVTAELVESC